MSCTKSVACTDPGSVPIEIISKRSGTDEAICVSEETLLRDPSSLYDLLGLYEPGSKIYAPNMDMIQRDGDIPIDVLIKRRRPQTVYQETPTAMVSEESNKVPTWLIVLLSILGVIILVGGGLAIYFATNKKSKEEGEMTSETPDMALI